MKEKTKKEFQKLKRLGITGLIRLLLSALGSFFAGVLVMVFVQWLTAYSDTLILFTSKEIPVFLMYVVICIEVFVVLYIALSFAEQGIRKLFGIKGAENFAEDSFDVLFDNDDEDEEIKKIIEEVNAEIKEEELSGTTDDDVSLKKVVAILVAIFLIIHGGLFYLNYSMVTVFNENNIIKKSLINPMGTTYSYSDIKSYTVEEDKSCPQFVLNTKSGEKLKVNYDNENTFCDKYDDYYTALVKVDSLLKENNVPKTVNCTKDDFGEFGESEIEKEEKEALDIILKAN